MRYGIVIFSLFLGLLGRGDAVLAQSAPFAVGGWTGWNPLPGGGHTNTSPSATIFDNELRVFAAGSVDRLVWLNSFDGGSWSGWKEVPGGFHTSSAPACTQHDSRLYLFAVGEEDKVNVTQFNGTAWDDWSEVFGGGHTNVALSATSFEGSLYLFAKGSSDQLVWVNVLNGTSWTGWKEVPGGFRTNSSPNAVTYQDELCLFCKGPGEAISMNRFDGQHWRGWQRVPGDGHTNSALGAATDQARLYIFAKGSTDQKIYVNAWAVTPAIPPSPNGPLHPIPASSKWSGWIEIPGDGHTDCGPAGSLFGGQMYLFVKGGGEEIIYVNRSNGNVTNPPPWVSIHLLIVPLSDKETNASGTLNHAYTVTPVEFSRLIDRVNLCYSSARIRFLFDPETDWQPMADTDLNREKGDYVDRQNNFSASHLGKMVCFLRWGNDPKNPESPTGNGNAYPPPGAGPMPENVEDHVQNFVELPDFSDPGYGGLNQGGGGFMAHEFGHYLGLYHTFPGWSDRTGPLYSRIDGDGPLSVTQADEAIVDYILAHGQQISALDGDLLSDTPPDPSPVIFQAHNQDICNVPMINVQKTVGSRVYNFELTPDPMNIMSYFGTCPTGADPPTLGHFSPQQIARLRSTLMHSARRHLLSGN
jgi:hypothetical protein